MNDRLEGFIARYGLDAAAREELEQMLQGYGLPMARVLPDSHADSTLMFDPEDLAAASNLGATPSDPNSRERYEDMAFIGRGAFAEVRRVRDRALNRVMAMKILDVRSHEVTAMHRARFVQEAQATSQLVHPAIVPVHELGTLPDGRLYFTMEEVRGRTLSAVVDAVHEASQDVWSRTADGWSLRRLVEVFRRVCEAVAYAHSRGVVHRDLKPANVMVGAFGEVRVMDWGIAKVLGSPMGMVDAVHGSNDALSTRAGTVAGTPAFMAPEQARGELHKVDRRTDVFALGAMLHYILRNAPPYEGSNSASVLERVAQRAPEPLVGRVNGPMLPAPLVAVAEHAMAHAPEDRYADASLLAADVLAWLDGAERHESALRAVGAAAEERRRAKKSLQEGRAIRARAEAELEAIPSHAPEEAKHAAWDLLEQADALEANARDHELAMETQLNAALAHAPELQEGHLLVARVHKTHHAEAERAGDKAGAARLERLLRTHLGALGPSWPGRASLDAYLAGDGTLSLETEPSGMSARLYRYEREHRRLVPRLSAELGETPIRKARVPMGSYLVELEGADGELALLPVEVGRQEKFTLPGAVVVPGDLEPGEAYVPAGWFRAGGDPRARYGAAGQRLWCDAFAIQVFPVTHAEWLAFVLAEGSDRHVPRDDDGNLLYTRDGATWALETGRGRVWLPDAPVTHVSWHDAEAYAAWRAKRDRVPWRLPFELEWEKAARGVDGRGLPWGDEVDPSWCNMRGSLEGPPQLVAVEQFPVDSSPYGVRGMAGNSADWCLDAFDPIAAQTAGDRVVRDQGAPNARFRVVRGGSYRDGSDAVRCASRWRMDPNERSGRIGLRLARTIDV